MGFWARGVQYTPLPTPCLALHHQAYLPCHWDAPQHPAARAHAECGTWAGWQPQGRAVLPGPLEYCRPGMPLLAFGSGQWSEQGPVTQREV